MLTLAMMLLAAAPPTEPCDARLLDYARWKEAPGQAWDYRGGPLTIVGAEHLRTPEHPQFARIGTAFAAAKPSIAFYEGPDRGVGGDAADTIATRGESGYLRFLAAQAGIKARSLEPSPPQQMKMLLAEFPTDQVMLFFVLREANRLRDREAKTGDALDQAVAALLQRTQSLQPMLGVPLPFADIAGLEAAAARYWPGRDWRKLPPNWFSPLADDTQGSLFTGAINRADSNNRNRHMFGLLQAAIGTGETPFVVVGRNHVPMLKPALDCALKGRP